MTLSEPLALAYIAAAYLAGSTVKGITGFGALLIAVPLMSLVMEPASAIALTGVPVLVSNLWQVAESRHFSWALRRFWLLFLFLVPATFAGSQFLATSDSRLSAAVIGSMVVLFCLLRLRPVSVDIRPRSEKWTAPVAGTLAGLIGGATIMAGSMLVMYLVALKLHKDQFVGAIALIYLCTSVPIYLTLSWFGRIEAGDMALSAALLVPAVSGLALGRQIRNRVPQEIFQKVVIALLLAIGVMLIARAL